MENMNNDSFATELLQEVRLQTKRWFVAFVIMVVLELGTIVGFVWYLTLPIEDTITTQAVEDIEDGEITQIGGDNYGKSGSDEADNPKGDKE